VQHLWQYWLNHKIIAREKQSIWPLFCVEVHVGLFCRGKDKNKKKKRCVCWNKGILDLIIFNIIYHAAVFLVRDVRHTSHDMLNFFFNGCKQSNRPYPASWMNVTSLRSMYYQVQYSTLCAQGIDRNQP
jgi:hypothetical protein